MITKINPHIARLMTFHPTMFAAMLANKKTVTRRMNCAYKPGDVIAAATGWRTYNSLDGVKPTEIDDDVKIARQSDSHDQFMRNHAMFGRGKLRPGRFLPRAWYHHCPLLRIVDVRQEPLQAITEADAILEGIEQDDECFIGLEGTPYGPRELRGTRFFNGLPQFDEGFEDGVEAFAALIDHIHKPGTWASNPLVWRIQFERFTPPTAEQSSVDRTKA
jgi:hypothetical protein